jgi:hypothetical protein
MIFKAVVHFNRYTIFSGYRWFEKRGKVQAESEDRAREMLRERAERVAQWWDQRAYYVNHQITTVGYIELEELA